MQLTKIKLAGFKSFVDPTTVLLPTNLVAIVGPNGCGKSNIIDAVCWVMGESSAKYLRGESLTDVIFNGSTARKPVGQSSVELVFDNSDGSIGGEYASYAEISIRRQIARDAESAYFLNGMRCRRRDIIDIFLGTGLGPRSYSIIGQNMIQRVIEAKPEEMRVYLEEAAGVSKYKERRRETENRIQHTKDNLARLNDVRAELDKQLNTLKRQSNAAEKFKLLKEEERLLRAQWLAIQWRHYDSRLVSKTLHIQQQATGLEARQAELNDINLQFEYKRDAKRLADDQFQDVQRHYYSIGSEVTRLEQDIQYHQARRQQWEADYAQAEHDWLESKTHLDESEQTLEELTTEMHTLGPQAAAALEEAEAAFEELTDQEDAMQTWQIQWEAFNKQTARNMQIAEVEQTRIQHLEQTITALQQRITTLNQDKDQFDFSQLDTETLELEEQLSALHATMEEHKQQLQDVQKNRTQLQAQQQQTTEELNQVRKELQALNGQQASLEALQETAQGLRNNPVVEWLQKHQLEQKPRLAQALDVTPGWENAVETVLGTYLQAICVDELADVASLVEQFTSGNLRVVAKTANATQLPSKANSLLTKVKSSWPIDALLKDIYIAESHPEALALCASLAAHESVITRDGMWLGASWLSVSRAVNPEAGVLQRKQDIKKLATTMMAKTQVQDALSEKLTHLGEALADLECQRNDIQKAINEDHAQISETAAQQKILTQRLTEWRARADHYQKEYNDCSTQLLQTQNELTIARAAWHEAMVSLEQQEPDRNALTQQRETLRDTVHAARNHVNQTKDQAHRLDIRLQTTKSQQSSLQQGMQRLQSQLATLAERKATLYSELSAESSVENLRNDLENALKSRILLQGELTNARHAMDSINQELHALELKRQEVERDIARFRDMLEALRVELHGVRIKAETLVEQLHETGSQLEEVLQGLPDDAAPDEWHARLEQVGQRIHRLGPINLIAIEEYQACFERKHYLDKQHDDLQEGLTILENAIEKIDKETRTRFKQTFDKVNARFQELFPIVFGGGHAYLELTGENLLDTGITVMACPPGKRNSTIHLLSGGEKAMTAVALVFSIFHLNPAPFCMLDEVDAPLDDANIGRFCQLVKTMAEKTQFIFISHNKLAIEMGETLIGVTMNEPGVSRLVTVDVQQAMTLAGV